MSTAANRAPARIAAVVLAAILSMALFVPTGSATSRTRPNCPNATLPPPPVDSSEEPAPGEPSPEPLPVPEEPIGGPGMGSCGPVVPPGAPAPPGQLSSAAWIVAELGSGRVLAAKNPHGRYRPASVIKILTALVAVRELDPSETITATRADAEVEGSSVGLEPGVTYTVRQVLAGLILQSGNDAAHALARELGGAEETVRRMNRLAGRLRAEDTRAATTSGLDGPGMSTSAYDMALILRAALDHPEFARPASAKRTQLPAPPGQPPLRIASDSDVMRGYPGAVFGKTGFTDDARHTRVVAAERNGRELVAVLLRGEHRPVDMSEQAAALLDYGFRLDGRQAVGKLVARRAPEPSTTPTSVPVEAAQRSSEEDGGRFGRFGVGFLVLLVLAVVTILAALRTHHARRRIGGSVGGRRDDPGEHG
ncbi:D-alanyl-D-alanine carboxypeptidase (penicillin-binding protein 5/6) [Actinopolyspora xinjiangensis]|uniref:D-alanyl-D-alanine carboxypeptidase (Penicillin-binding protein 5/6) n=1 Tax=Actinopolyspora xinjiangensis TaxID=405564 RepID=A0A1H0QH91_9ACTN|nr:D-alanyl-D-alanine carboxypeptidase family protein [Actinopolyspora xinjiangensis]SDP16096.1 D-alanyl-D-alanine carboxypeptidase (penicillin-binding protein 5/6) [Actinopolyspora xinjiangensis]